MLRKTIPVLVHVDNLPNTQNDNVSENVEEINANTSSIKTSSANTATRLMTIMTNTGSTASSIGLTADPASSNTVIGLLKSIVNKL